MATKEKIESKEEGVSSLREMLNGFEDSPPPAMEVFQAAVPFINSVTTSNDKSHFDTLDKLCRYIAWSLKQETPRNSYISCGFSKEHAVVWMEHLKQLLNVCVRTVAQLKPDRVSDSTLLTVILSAIVSILSSQGWAVIYTAAYKHLAPGMSKLSASLFSHVLYGANLFKSINGVLLSSLSRPGKTSLTRASLLALTALANRPFSENSIHSVEDGITADYIHYIFTVPGYVHYVHSICPEGLNVSILPLLIEALRKEEDLISDLANDDLNLVLSLLANLVEMGSYHESLSQIFHETFEGVISKLLNVCASKTKDQTKSHWHPILGWVSYTIPPSFLNAASSVKAQIEILWSPVYLEAMFLPLRSFLVDHRGVGSVFPKLNDPGGSLFKTTSVRNGIMKCFHKMMNSGETTLEQASSLIKFNADITISTSRACSLYSSLVKIFPLCRMDVLNGICFKCSSQVLIFLWEFLQILGGEYRLGGWIEFLLANENSKQESILVLFVEAMTHLITILDDHEIFEEQKIFKLQELADMGLIINSLCYRMISHNSYAKFNENTLTAAKSLLMVLYRRDCRRKFCPDGHWLIESSKMHQLINDIEKCRRNAKRILLDMPHIVREENRIMFFRKWVQSEKALNGNSSGQHDVGTSSSGSALITVQRGRIVEDGYAHLANLSSKALKGTIRVRFKNEYGLDEAGIDQDGVFKEFLEETIKAVFNPTLNLFKATMENLLYPSPLSYLHDNHLELFEFVGKMLGKAVYEGIVVDVRFAPFFLSQILGLQRNTLFSLIDEIQSLDRDLYNSMNYIKHYEGDVKDLELFFSVDQDVLGELKTTEFMTGGRAVRVTNENKISYLYYLARFHLYVEIKDQTAAFLKGFRSIISTEWLKIFSPSEFQRLISGEDSDIDLVDLRRNTQYYGGFHDNHRVIVWFWDVLERDFNENERRLLLKFVTSCSKPPLLGFMNLEPPFSIRCVEVSEDEDTGDTIGSVVRGFLALGKKEPIGRLPTSSTCFNLLKLPNYQRRSTLREKLRCAITSNVGFELS